MHNIHEIFSWKIWIFFTGCCLISNALSVVSSNVCTTCEEKCSTEILNSGNCYCEHRSFYREEKRWNNTIGPYGSYVRQKVLTYSTAECFELKNMDENSALDGSTCPEDECRYISFRRSTISTIPKDFFKNASYVEEIRLMNTGIENLQVGSFSGVTKLRLLYLGDNKLTDILNGTFNTLTSLRSLDLHNNSIRTIQDTAFVGLESLMYLDLSNNKLSAISGTLFETLENLGELNLSNNFLSVVDFDISELKRLGTLYLNHNNIDRIAKCFGETDITSLYLEDNKISVLNESCLPNNVSILNLANNNIGSLDFDTIGELKKLRTFNISNNSITSIPINTFKNCEKLDTLDLSHNKLTQLGIGVFSKTKNIENLYLKGLNIKKIEPYLLISLSKLYVFDISGNDLDSLDSEIFEHFENLREINIKNNRNFLCDSVVSMVKFAEKKRIRLIHDIDYNVENIDGLPCTIKRHRSDRKTTNKSNVNEKMRDVKENHTYEDLLKLMQTQQDLLEKICDEIKSIKLLIAEKEQLKKK